MLGAMTKQRRVPRAGSTDASDRFRRTVTWMRVRYWPVSEPLLHGALLVLSVAGMFLAFPSPVAPARAPEWRFDDPDLDVSLSFDVGERRGERRDVSVFASTTADHASPSPAYHLLLTFMTPVRSVVFDGQECAERELAASSSASQCWASHGEGHVEMGIPIVWDSCPGGYCTGNAQFTLESGADPFLSDSGAQVMARVPEWGEDAQMLLDVPDDVEYVSGPVPGFSDDGRDRFVLGGDSNTGLMVGARPSFTTDRDWRLLLSGALAGLAGAEFVALLEALRRRRAIQGAAH